MLARSMWSDQYHRSSGADRDANQLDRGQSRPVSELEGRRVGSGRAAAEEACARGVRLLRTHIDFSPLLENAPVWHVAQQVRCGMSPRVILLFATLSRISHVISDDLEEFCRQIVHSGGAYHPNEGSKSAEKQIS